MKPLSPVDAIAPAFSRMRTVLTPPAGTPGEPQRFRFGFFFKMVLVAALTNAAFYGASFGFGLQGAGFAASAAGTTMTHRHIYHAPSFIAHQAAFVAPSGTAVAITAALAIAGLIALALWVLCGWLWSRLRFTLFDLVVYRGGRVAVAWSEYGRQAWRYFGLMVLVGLALLLMVAATAGPLFLHLFAVLRHMTPQQINADPAVIFEHILPMYGVIFLFGLTATVADAITQDFLLPPMALEDAPLEVAFGRFFSLVRDRFWGLLGYLLLRFVMEIGLTWAALMAVFVVLLILGLGGAGIGFILYRALWHLGGFSAAMFVAYCVVAGLILLGLYLLAMICVYGIVALFKQCYAVYFYGSHYRELGNRIEPPEPTPAPEPVVPPPPSLSPGLEPPPPIW